MADREKTTVPAGSALLAALLPASVAVAAVRVPETADVSPHESEISVFPGEEDPIASATEGRRREFAEGRRCAREAMAKLGLAPVAIGTGPRREPLWPAGVVGAITHCRGFRAAAVARATDVDGLGIDAEPHEGLPPGVRELVVAEGDEVMLRGLAAAAPGTHWDRVLFSAKESVYKAWFPLTGRWLGFEDASLTILPDTGTFVARIQVDGTRTDGRPPLRELAGRFAVADGFILTALTVT
jgi:4'-phosphopantetheinyl transferase EntD